MSVITGAGRARLERGKPVPGQKQSTEAIIEFHRIGNSVKVTAIDTLSQVEVSIIAPANYSERQMSDAAMKKLQYVLARKGDKR